MHLLEGLILHRVLDLLGPGPVAHAGTPVSLEAGLSRGHTMRFSVSVSVAPVGEINVTVGGPPETSP